MCTCTRALTQAPFDCFSYFSGRDAEDQFSAEGPGSIAALGMTCLYIIAHVVIALATLLVCVIATSLAFATEAVPLMMVTYVYHKGDWAFAKHVFR